MRHASTARAASLATTALLAAALLAGCGEGEEEGATMMPGSNCLASGCHAAGEHRFTAAGTVYAAGDAAAGDGLAGATVRLTPTGGAAVVLPTNAAGNFFTAANLGAGYTIEISGNGGTVTRPAHGSAAFPSGGCGGCHQPGNAQGAPARVHVCASCHAA